MPVYEFEVRDGPDERDGFWGEMRAEAPSQANAEMRIRTYLDEYELFPNGSIDPPYCLTLVRVDGRTVADDS